MSNGFIGETEFQLVNSQSTRSNSNFLHSNVVMSGKSFERHDNMKVSRTFYKEKLTRRSILGSVCPTECAKNAEREILKRP